MPMIELLQSVANAALEMTWQEIVAVATGVACVALTVRQNVWCWPVGIVSSALFIWVFMGVQLYPDAFLQVCFILISFYGWYRWVRPSQNKRELPVATFGVAAMAATAALGALGTAGVGWFFADAMPRMFPELAPAAAPYIDSGILVFSLIAQAGLSRKVLQNWLVWIGIDLVAIFLYWSREIYLTSLLYVAFLALATLGFLAWRKAWRKQNALA